ncbi:hypothetical protein T459_04357 [Capsicum annuum]|uniref:Pep3/Vps18 beta-propeller domain-containing protein n=1 Tax=Capsicum annuum TaxID=4072 RepID=A0A2G3A4U5_CAPAN|nr:hypothetical protein T459_04357 [Capsicum annuum]
MMVELLRFLLSVNCTSLSSKGGLYTLHGFLEQVVNRISEQIVGELYFDQTPDAVSRGIIGLCSDASAGLFYAYDQNSIFQVSVNDEGRDMWKVYLNLKEYAAALASCRDAMQRDQVYLAEAAFVAKEFLRAASFYAKINYVLSFEEISLKFISIGEQDALRTFLLRKLDSLSKDEKCQITMISTWATELYLDKVWLRAFKRCLKSSSNEAVRQLRGGFSTKRINRLLLEDDGALDSNNTEYQSLIKEFRAFLSDCKDVLDEATTMKLLESYGRVDELVFFASLKEQYEIVLHHYIQQQSYQCIPPEKSPCPQGEKKKTMCSPLALIPKMQTFQNLEDECLEAMIVEKSVLVDGMTEN